MVWVSNGLGTELTVQLKGPEALTLSIPVAGTRSYCLVPGTYEYAASAFGYTGSSGRASFTYDPADCTCWWWTPEGLQPIYPYGYRRCQCQAEPGLYGPAPLKPGTKAWSLKQASAHCTNPNLCVILPAPGSTITGNVTVIGSANAADFERYKVEWWGQGGSGWAFLLEKDAPVVNGELLMLNTSTVPAGQYGLRLTVIDRSGNYGDPYEIWWTVAR